MKIGCRFNLGEKRRFPYMSVMNVFLGAAGGKVLAFNCMEMPKISHELNLIGFERI